MTRASLGLEAAFDGSFLDGPALVPGEVEDLPGSLHVGFLEHVDGFALEHQGEATIRVCPGQANLAMPMLRTGHARGSSVEERLEIEGVRNFVYGRGVIRQQPPEGVDP